MVEPGLRAVGRQVQSAPAYNAGYFSTIVLLQSSSFCIIIAHHE